MNHTHTNNNHQTNTVMSFIQKKQKFTARDKALLKYSWGFGLEHETQFFHLRPPNPQKPIQELLIYNALDTTVDLIESKKINQIDRHFLEEIPFEATGRRCHGEWVLKKTPIGMPEFVTKNPFSSISTGKNTIDDWYKELLEYELRFYNILTTNSELTKKQMSKYGILTHFPYGMSSYIRMAKDYFKLNYKLTKERITDYLGSFHVTITLPFDPNNKTKKAETEFVKRHQNFANQFQWIEPLLLSAFFSCDQKAVASKNKRVRGSYRVMRIGWGNFAGSDVRKFNKGIGRYANIKTYWRKNLNFYGINKLKPCYKPNPKLKEKDAVSLLSSNMRTFGSTDPERPWHRESGAPMNIPNGIEIRIFDHFQPIFLISLLRIIILIAANSDTTKTKQYVYEDQDWINAMHKIMKRGWLGVIDKKYILKLEKTLDIKLKKSSKKSKPIAYNILVELVEELWKKNHNHDYIYLMCNDGKMDMPKIPNINRSSWELAFMMKMANKPKQYQQFINMVNEMANLNTKINIDIYENIYEKYLSGKSWWKNRLDVLYFLQSRDIVSIKTNKTKEITVNKNNLDVLNYITSWEIFAEFADDKNHIFQTLKNFTKTFKKSKSTNTSTTTEKYLIKLLNRMNNKFMGFM